METKHTKGIWKQESTNILTDERLVANCCGNGSGVTPEDLANAKLIASAPEMLNMLDVILKAYINHSDKPSTRLILECKELIKKATL